MKKYSELGHVYRCEPCIEYPGKWISYVNGVDERIFSSFDEARKDASDRQDASPNDECETSVCWRCSDDDPRIGQVWFTGFYQHGKFDIFGRYRT